ncbi:unnamed protein product [Arabidopsis halleri]
MLQSFSTPLMLPISISKRFLIHGINVIGPESRGMLMESLLSITLLLAS